MKQSLTLLFLTITVIASAQKRSYVQAGASGYIATKGSDINAGVVLGAGSSRGAGGVGINVELLSGKNQLLLPVYADCRFYFSPKKTSPYVTMQAGYNFRNKPTTPADQYTTVKDKGGIYTGAGIGMFVLGKKIPGFNMQLKYVFMQDKIVNTYDHNSTTIIVTNTHSGFISLCAAFVI